MNSYNEARIEEIAMAVEAEILREAVNVAEAQGWRKARHNAWMQMARAERSRLETSTRAIAPRPMDDLRVQMWQEIYGCHS